MSPTVAIADFPFINFALSEDGFNGYLTTSRSAERFAELASTPNEAAVANALDTATSSLAWQQVVGASTAEAQRRLLEPQQRFDPRERRGRPLRAIAFPARRRARPAAAGFSRWPRRRPPTAC